MPSAAQHQHSRCAVCECLTYAKEAFWAVNCNLNSDLLSKSLSFYYQHLFFPRGQLCHSHSAECLCDISFIVIVQHMVSGCDILWCESGTKDDLPDFPLSLSIGCCNIFFDKAFFSLSWSNSWLWQARQEGKQILLQLLLEGQERKFHFREMRMAGISWWHRLWV